MKPAWSVCLVVLVLVAMFTPRSAYAANAVVGNGSPASCTEVAFDAALAVATRRRRDDVQLRLGHEDHRLHH